MSKLALAIATLCVALLISAAMGSEMLFARTSSDTAPVTVYACDFVKCRTGFSGAKVLLLENPAATFTTDVNGYVTTYLPVGSQATFIFPETEHFEETTAATVTVPVGGLTDKLNLVVLQVPSKVIYDLFSIATNGHKDKSKCQLVVTVCNANRTIWSFPQGIPGAKVHFYPTEDSTETYYFGTWGKLSNKTDPLPNHRTTTSWDGGVMLLNIPVNATALYTVTAEMPGFVFSSTTIKCVKPGFVNGAPNQGPRIIGNQ